MRAVLYWAVSDQISEWRVSLDPVLTTDWAYWLRRDPSIRIRRVAELLPFGQALAELERIQARVPAQVPLRSSALTSTAVSMPSRGGTPPNNQARWRTILSALTPAEPPGALPEEDRGRLDKLARAMTGRALLAEEFSSLVAKLFETEFIDWVPLAQTAYLEGCIQYSSGIRMERRKPRIGFARDRTACRRCGSSGASIIWSECASCGMECPYCEACLTMGRARFCSPLLLGTMQSERTQASVTLDRLQLSEAQAVAASSAVDFLLGRGEAAKVSALERMGAAVRCRTKTGSQGSAGRREPRKFLIWAVTGAGKTEMMFPLVEAELNRGGRVAIATPRKDVVLELLPRVQDAFAGCSVAGLYGGSMQRWETADITIATTHQLYRFEAAFDLVVLDEVDAFPYHNNPMLEYAARKSCKPGGTFVLLSATPPDPMQRAARKGRLAHVKVPVRYHRHPLPVPAYGSPSKLIQLLRGSLDRDAQVFVFVPSIARLEPELQRLRQALAAECAAERIQATSSQDAMRAEKVLAFRAGDIRILLTTTILERGVTIPKSDVIVLDADSRLFDAAALVQMAGRAGRSALDPHGQVCFLARHRTRAQAAAVRQIRMMNRLARKMGYLIEG